MFLERDSESLWIEIIEAIELPGAAQEADPILHVTVKYERARRQQAGIDRISN